MNEIVLEGSSWKTSADFYRDFLSMVGAPSWHGHNLDALNDSLGAGDINQVNPPFSVRILGMATMSPEAKQTVERFRELIGDLRAEGVQVEIQLER